MSLTDKQLAMRRGGIGASEAAAVCGVSQYRTPLDVWADKIGVGPARVETEQMQLGHLLEPVIVSLYDRRVAPAHRWEGGTVRHPHAPLILATPDADRDDGAALVECKKAGARQRARWGEPGTDQVPDEYLIQAQLQCAVIDRAECHVAVLLDDEFRVYVIRRHDPLIASVIERCERFWRDYVEPRRMPPLDESGIAREVLLAMYPREREPLAPWPAGVRTIAEQLATVKREAKALAKVEKQLHDKLCAEIGTREGFEGDGARVTWKTKEGNPAWKTIATSLAPFVDWSAAGPVLGGGDLETLTKKYTGKESRELRLHGFTADEQE